MTKLVHINRDPSLENVWLNRHQDKAGMKASKKALAGVSDAGDGATMRGLVRVAF